MRYEGLALQCQADPTPQDDALAKSKMQPTDKKCQERHLLGYMGGRSREWVKFEFYCLPWYSNIDAKILKNEPFCFIWR